MGVFEQRKLAALEWHEAAGASSKQKIAEAPQVVPGEGHGPERLQLAVRALVETESDVGSFDVHRLRREIACLLGIPVETLADVRSSQLMRLVLEEVDEFEERQQDAAPQLASSSPAAPNRASTATIDKGTCVKLKQNGRVGEVLVHDPDDGSMSFKLQFSDGELPAVDWFSADAVDLSA